MKNTTLGVDPSVSSTSSPIAYTSDGPISTPTNVGVLTPPAATITIPDPDLPILERPENFGTVCHLVNGIVTPNMQILLASVLGSIDASIPNKDQNKAVKHIIRKQFDDAYVDIQRRAYPDCAFGTSAEYYLEPNPKAFQPGPIRA